MSLRRKLLYGKPKSPYLPKAVCHEISPFTVQLDGVILHGWLALPHGYVSGAILYFNGRRESPTTIFRFLSSLKNQAVAVFHSRGLGPSTGTPSEKALVDDGLLVLDWLCARTQLPLSSITIVGRSLGSGIAIQVSAIREVAGLTLISPFDSLVHVIRKHIRFFPSFLLEDKFYSVGYISKVRCPVLAITGARDTTIPTELSRTLFDNWDGQLAEHEVPEGRHRGLLRYPSVENAVASFITAISGEAGEGIAWNHSAMTKSNQPPIHLSAKPVGCTLDQK